jgi:RimJ/RimL family protein N-acetyltransferase
MSGYRADGGLILKDDELRLRMAKLPSDALLAEAWYTDPEVMYYSEGDETASYDIEMIEKMYRCLADQGELYIAELLINEQWVPIGDVTLAADTIPIVIGVAEFRSRGYGKRILKLLVDRAISLGWRKLKIKRVHTFILRSKRLYESLGFEQEGDIFHEDGITCWRFIKQL